MKANASMMKFLLFGGLIGSLMPLSRGADADPSPAPKPPGKLVDIGGYRLHYLAMGKEKPTVVLIYGDGAFSVDWALVQPEIAKFARVVAYDRAGDGWSDFGPQPQTMPQDACELHALLKKAKIAPPYILVGHSLGGLIARWYARQYPGEVAGMALVDATDDDAVLNMNGADTRVRTTSKGRAIPPVQTRLSATAASPSSDALKKAGDFIQKYHPERIYPPFDRLPKKAQEARIRAASRPEHYCAEDPYWGEEFQALYDERHSGKPPLGYAPLVVLIPESKPDPAEKPHTDEERRFWAEKRERKIDQANLSWNGRVVFVQDSVHEIHLSQPEALANAIREIVEETRKSMNR